jgi:putative hemolysin
MKAGALGGLTLLLLVVALAIAGIGLAQSIGLAAAALPAMDLSNGHPVEKHGAGLNAAITQCFDQNGSMMSFINRETGRRADLCQMPDGKFALRISERTNGGWRMVTQFLKEKLRTLNDVVRYLGNTGYDPIQ